MDPFLPGDIAVMVLRYLAANKCEAAAMSLIEEMPLLKGYVPPKPPTVSKNDYVKHLARSYGTGLKDLLTDYGNSKILVEEMLDSSSILPSCGSDSLLSKLTAYQEVANSSTSVSGSHLSSSSSSKRNEIQVPEPVKVEQFTNTDAYQCVECSKRRAAEKNRNFSDSGCQTEEYTAVQFGLQDDIPRIFYNTLLSDMDLQQKIAQTINEHIEDPEEPKRGDMVQQISSKAETEIDKFLVELLKELPDDSNSTGGLHLHPGGIGGPTSFAEVGNSLSSIFKEAEVILGHSSNNQSSFGMTKDGPEKFQRSTVVQASSSNDDGQSTSAFTTPPTNDAAAGSATKYATDPNNASKTPNRPNSQSSVKRITPTPVPANAPPAVFNSSVLIEKKRIDFDGASAKCSVKTATIEPPAWQRLNRKPISPKIPDPAAATHKVVSNTRVTRDTSESVLNLGSGETKTSRAQVRTVRSGPTDTSKISPPGPSVVAQRQRENIPSSTHKRKTTPVKLTPEKAKNSHFTYINHEGSLNKLDHVRKSANSNIDSSLKKTPAVPSSAPLVQVNENSQPDVTPMQQIYQFDEVPSSSIIKGVSPNALQRLIASANKIGSTIPAANFFNNKKKSFSTPRKRKHVRSLTFATPPSLKAGTPGFEQKHGFETKTSKKRKSTDDLLSTESRSKKRLNWPDSEKKVLNKHRDHSPGHSLRSEDPKEGVTASVITKTANTPTPMSLPSDKPTISISAKDSMPTILEESMSAITADANTSISVKQSSPNPETNVMVKQVNTVDNEIRNISENFMIVTQPSGDTTGSQFFRVLGEKRGLIPVSLAANGQIIYQHSPHHVSSVTVTSPQLFTSCVALHGNAEVSAPNYTILSEPRPNLSNVLTLHANSPASSTELPPLPVQTYPLQEQPPLPAQPCLLPEKPPLPVQTYPLLEKPPLPAQPCLVPERPPLPVQTNPLLEKPPLPAQPCLLLEKPPLPLQTNFLLEKTPLPAQPSPLPEQPPLPVQSYPIQQVLPSPPPPLPVQPYPIQHHVPQPPPPPLEKPVQTSSASTVAGIPPAKSDRASTFSFTLSTENASDYPKIAAAPVKNVSASSQLESDQSGKSKRKKKSLENSSNNQRAGAKNDSKTSKSGHSKQENIQKQRDSRKEKSKRASSDGSGSSKRHRNSDPVEPPKSPVKSSPDIEIKGRSSRGRRSKSKEKSSKKPKLTAEDLFGDLSDMSMSTSDIPKTPKNCNKKETKLPVDVIAAQSVASEAVPLGNPRRSPRKHSVKPNPQKTKVSLDKIIPPNENSFTFPSGNADTRSNSVPDIPHGSNAVSQVSQDSYSIPFSIVPAPLGFPEPTPIKNFVETGYLGVFNHGFVSPLITPLKSMPPSNLNETQFTLPPTPRVIDDQDSNSNSMHSLRLFDGSLFPASFLASTPLKHGLPRTPGKGSNSSNSRSPPPAPPALVEEQGGRKEVVQSNKPLLLPTNPPQNIPSIIVSTPKEVPSSSSPVKSDGEISSSDGDDDEPSKAVITATKSAPPPRDKDNSSTAPIPNSSKPQVLVSSSSCNLPRNIPACPPTNTQPHIPLTVDPSMRHIPNSNFEFQVGNRGKKLTISEQETLYTLLEIGSSQSRVVNNKKPELQKPKPTEKASAPPKKSTTNDEPKKPFALLRNTNVADLIKYIHRQKAPQGLQPPPKK